MAAQSAREARRSFERLLEKARTDRNVVGFFLGGSRGKGRETKDSDYDVYVVVRDGVVRSYRAKYGRRNTARIEISVMSESEFRGHAAMDGPDAWNRYDFVHVEALLDKNGRIQRLIEEKGRIPKDRVHAYVSGRLDAYIEAVYRSFKNWSAGDSLTARLEAAESIPLFLDAVFALDGGRVRPYYKYLRWELETFPLTGFPITPARLRGTILRIVTTGEAESQRKLFLAAERSARRAGYGKVFDSWAVHRLGLGVRRFRRHHE